MPPPCYAESTGEKLTARELALRRVMAKYNLPDGGRAALQNLGKFDIVVLCDDSSSMNAEVSPSRTRWNELCDQVKPIVEIGAALDDDGIDIKFMNRGVCTNVKALSEVTRAFMWPASGSTPTCACLRRIFAEQREKPVLLFILTDGEPSDDAQPGEAKQGFRELLEHRDLNKFPHVTIAACTDEPRVLRYLNALDSRQAGVDVIDDFVSERAKVQAIQGPGFQFTPALYTMKLMCASNPAYDLLDETQVRANTNGTVSLNSSEPGVVPRGQGGYVAVPQAIAAPRPPAPPELACGFALLAQQSAAVQYNPTKTVQQQPGAAPKLYTPLVGAFGGVDADADDVVVDVDIVEPLPEQHQQSLSAPRNNRSCCACGCVLL